MPMPTSAPAKPSPPLGAGDTISSSPASPRDASKPSVVLTWDSEVLHKHAENLELEESKRISLDPALLSTLEGLLLEVYGVLRPKPIDYEQRIIMVDVFNKMANEIFGNKNGFPVVEAFGSFTMDLFTTGSDLDLSVNFNAKNEGDFARREKISIIRKFSKVLYSHQKKGRVCGVLPIGNARVPVLKVIDRGTGIECDISIENKDGMTRSMIFKLLSSLDERFQILSYLMKFWAKAHDVNSSKDHAMSSMSIISLVAFHLQTRHPPILPAFSALLKDGSDFASIEKNIHLFEEFGCRNKESIAELFVSLMSKLSSVESLWEQGLCASNYEGFWISKTWDKGVGNLNIEDFLDRSENFARAVGKAEVKKICECFRVSVSNLSGFMRGQIDASKLKTLLFGPLGVDPLLGKPCVEHPKMKRKANPEPEQRPEPEKRAKHSVHPIQPHTANYRTSTDVPTPAISMPPILCRPSPTQSGHQFLQPQPLVTPSGFGHGLSPLNFPVAPHISQGLLGQPLTDSILLNHGIQLHQQDPNLFVPIPGQQPVGNLFHSYNGTQQLRHDQNAMVHRMPYGISLNFRR